MLIFCVDFNTCMCTLREAALAKCMLYMYVHVYICTVYVFQSRHVHVHACVHVLVDVVPQMIVL